MITIHIGRGVPTPLEPVKSTPPPRPATPAWVHSLAFDLLMLLLTALLLAALKPGTPQDLPPGPRWTYDVTAEQ